MCHFFMCPTGDRGAASGWWFTNEILHGYCLLHRKVWNSLVEYVAKYKNKNVALCNDLCHWPSFAHDDLTAF